MLSQASSRDHVFVQNFALLSSVSASTVVSSPLSYFPPTNFSRSQWQNQRKVPASNASNPPNESDSAPRTPPLAYLADYLTLTLTLDPALSRTLHFPLLPPASPLLPARSLAASTTTAQPPQKISEEIDRTSTHACLDIPTSTSSALPSLHTSSRPPSLPTTYLFLPSAPLEARPLPSS